MRPKNPFFAGLAVAWEGGVTTGAEAVVAGGGAKTDSGKCGAAELVTLTVAIIGGCGTPASP